VPATGGLVEGVNGDVGNDQFVSAIVSAPGRLAAMRVIRRTAQAGALEMESSQGVTVPDTTWFFAGGSPDPTARAYLTIQNPGALPAHVSMTFLPQGGAQRAGRSAALTVGASGRATMSLPSAMATSVQQAAGMVVTSDQPVVAERVVYWGAGSGSAMYGATITPGVDRAGRQFDVVYGVPSHPGSAPASQTQQTRAVADLTIINPADAVSTTVSLTFTDSTGATLGMRSFTLAPRTAALLDGSALSAWASAPYAAVAHATQPIVVATAQYLGGSPQNLATGLPGLILADPAVGSATVLLPGAMPDATAGAPLSETAFLLNPGPNAMTITSTYYLAGGRTRSAATVVPAGHIEATAVNGVRAGVPPGVLGVQYTSSSGAFVAALILETPDQRVPLGR
jgi:hypothetical protein